MGKTHTGRRVNSISLGDLWFRYWPDRSDGNDPGNFQKRLSTYCQDDTINVFPLAFLHVFRALGGLPSLDLANVCFSFR